MKTQYIICMLLIVFMGAANFSIAQKKTKEEIALEKEWATKLKALKPLDYKKLVEDKDALSGTVAECENSKSSIKSELETSKTELDAKSIENAKLKKELEDYNSGMVPGVVQSKTTATSTKTTSATTAKTVAGVVFKVQIGSFKTKDLTKYFDNNPNFSGEVDADGSKKYTLGLFTDYWEADKFKKALREMGVKGAWVVPYKDGQRVNLKDVLEGAL
jgi:hypothetical protein